MTPLYLYPLLVLLTFPSSRADDSLDNYIRAVLEQFKSQMTTGIPDLGIPILDPFAVPHFDIPHISEGIAEVDITLDDLVITNLSTFETSIVHADTTALSLELGLAIEKLRGDAIYSIDGVIASLFPIYGDGPMWLELYKVVLNGHASLTLTADGYIQVAEMTLDADMESIKMHMDNLLGPGNLGEVLNEIINLMGKTIWDLFKGDLFNLLNTTLKDLLNDALGQCSLEDILNNGSCFINVINNGKNYAVLKNN